MTYNNPASDKPKENVSFTTTDQFSPGVSQRPENMSLNAEGATGENSSTITPQANAEPASKTMNPALSRALVGGLVGATLGTLAGILAGKRTSRGVNHAVKGVGDATKTVAGGVNQTARGVGDAVKSVAEGVNYAVVGTLKDTTQGVNQVFSGTLNAVQDAAESVKPSVKEALDAVNGQAEDVKPSDSWNAKEAKERVIITNNSSGDMDEDEMKEQVGTQTKATLDSQEIEGLVDKTRDVNSETSVDYSETDFC